MLNIIQALIKNLIKKKYKITIQIISIKYRKIKKIRYILDSKNQLKTI